MKDDYVMGEDLQAMLAERKRTMLEFTNDYEPLNMYVILREDLEMPAPKMAAQAGHAFDICHDRAKIERPEITSQYKGTGNGTKICMGAKNMRQLERAYRDCLQAGIPCELIIDRGHVLLPHFTGEPIYTALGIGPTYKKEVAHILKRYSLIKGESKEAINPIPEDTVQLEIKRPKMK